MVGFLKQLFSVSESPWSVHPAHPEASHWLEHNLQQWRWVLWNHLFSLLVINALPTCTNGCPFPLPSPWACMLPGIPLSCLCFAYNAPNISVYVITCSCQGDWLFQLDVDIEWWIGKWSQTMSWLHALPHYIHIMSVSNYPHWKGNAFQ